MLKANCLSKVCRAGTDHGNIKRQASESLNWAS